LFLLCASLSVALSIHLASAADPSALEHDIPVGAKGEEKRVGIGDALALLNVPSASVALIDEGRIAFSRAYGRDVTPDTLYQAASLSKFVAAIGAMRLVESGTLKLDEDVNDKLTSWKVPGSAFDATRKVTLRGLLSMTGGSASPASSATRSALGCRRSRRFSTGGHPPIRLRSR
jgi:CubicO group peptidase (beta-lactamase class C family)